jgi:hypothetical protein
MRNLIIHFSLVRRRIYKKGSLEVTLAIYAIYPVELLVIRQNL